MNSPMIDISLYEGRLLPCGHGDNLRATKSAKKEPQKFLVLCAENFDCLRAHISEQPHYILLEDLPHLRSLLKDGEGEERAKGSSSCKQQCISCSGQRL